MTDNNYQHDIANITLKCLGLKFPVFHVRTEVGPKVVTHYFRPAPGSSAPLSNVVNRSNDIAFSCGVETCMITRVKGEIAFAIPLTNPKLISFVDATSWLMTNKAAMKDMDLPLLMGQTPTGEYYSIDLATQPHMLISGSTGGGKSVFISELLLSLSLLKDPSELHMFLVDTKQLDLTMFAGLPHVKSVITKVEVLHQVLDSLMDLVRKRTDAMSKIARNIHEWNKLAAREQDKMSFKLLVIDEFADVIDQDKAIYGSTVAMREGFPYIMDKVKSLTQISRAAGIHLILATQRPSVKVVTGDLKTNIPMRLSFKMPTATDSIVILGEGGAENLLGKGDYLYQSFENPDVRRGHGAFVRAQDIFQIITDNDMIRQTMKGVSV